MPGDRLEAAALMRVAVTGAGGRLGTALVAALSRASFVGEVLAWDLPEHDLDDPESAMRLVGRNRPDVVIHAAAWTDVDGCARDPQLAMRRNGTAAGEMAQACATHGTALIAVSTNEVFDGLRTDLRPYRPTDLPSPANAYGVAKLAGEQMAREAFWATGDDFAAAALMPPEGRDTSIPPLAVVRTAWLFGPPGADFPHKILAAAARAWADNKTLDLVSDEVGCPTYSADLAAAIASLVELANAKGRNVLGGIHHVVNGGHASRAEWAREVLRLAGVTVPTRDVPLSTWPRPSAPPPWGVLEPTPLPGGPLRAWQAALAEDLTMQTRTQEPLR
ncbi:MAG: NAD(P)-dependent oxidoreductase [Candidatus Limnocylindrales bacterium]|jgi:dTDP-4-dehydrorhamnose reductase